jgi:hypothetical protein
MTVCAHALPAAHQVPRIVAQFQQRVLVRDKIVVPALFNNAVLKKTLLDLLLDVQLMVPLRLDDAHVRTHKPSRHRQPPSW